MSQNEQQQRPPRVSPELLEEMALGNLAQVRECARAYKQQSLGKAALSAAMSSAISAVADARLARATESEVAHVADVDVDKLMGDKAS